jgi:hypothetical protein
MRQVPKAFMQAKGASQTQMGVGWAIEQRWEDDDVEDAACPRLEQPAL